MLDRHSTNWSPGLLPPEIEAVEWTPTQVDILDAIWRGRGQGITGRELYEHSGVTERTASGHLQRMRDKLPEGWRIFVEQRRYYLDYVGNVVERLPEEIREVRWTRRELQILDYATRRQGNQVRLEELVGFLYAGDVGGGPDDATGVVQVFVTRIRRKLVGTGWMLDDRRNLVRGEQTIQEQRRKRGDSHTRSPLTLYLRDDLVGELRLRAEREGRKIGWVVEEVLARDLCGS